MLCNVKLFLAFEDLYGNLISFNTTTFKSFEVLNQIDRAFTEMDYPNFFCRTKKGYNKSHIQNLLRSTQEAFLTQERQEFKPFNPKTSREVISKVEEIESIEFLEDPQVRSELKIKIPTENEHLIEAMKVPLKINSEK